MREILGMDEGFRRYLIQFQEWTKSYCAPVFHRDDSDQLRNGSMTFVNTGQEVLGITAGHVADSIIKFAMGGRGMGVRSAAQNSTPVSKEYGRSLLLIWATRVTSA